MRRMGIVVAAAGLLAAIASGIPQAYAQERERDSDMNGIMVQGKGEVQVKPDIARLTLGVQTQAADSTRAAEQNAEITQKVTSAIRGAGVAEKDIQTNNYSIYPQYENPRPEPAGREPRQPQIIGYQVSNTVRVTVRKVGDVGRMIDAAVKAGANVAGGIAFDLDDPTKAKEEALRKAVADAQRKAQVVADAAKVPQIRLVAVQEGSVDYVRPMHEAAFARAADAATPVSPGEQTVTATVTARYRMVVP